MTAREDTAPITYAAFAAEIASVFSANALALPDSAQTEQLYTLLCLLDRANRHMNLTAIRDAHGVLVRHFADCALAAPCFPTHDLVADIGAGAGFPTLPLAILRPDLQWVAVDATAKRVEYVRQSAQTLSLHRVSAVCARAEALGHASSFRESFDAVCARAVARMHILCELCLPLCRVGGVFLAMKGKNALQEWDQAAHGATLLGGTLHKDHTLYLYDPNCSAAEPDACAARHVLCIAKTAPTPPLYPRAYGSIVKKPL